MKVIPVGFYLELDKQKKNLWTEFDEHDHLSYCNQQAFPTQFTEVVLK